MIPMTNRRFGRQVRRISRHKLRNGEMTQEEFDKIRAASWDMKIVERWRTHLEQPRYGAPWVGKGELLTGIDWASIWEWLTENWVTILQVLLSLLVFLGDENENQESGAESPRS